MEGKNKLLLEKDRKQLLRIQIAIIIAAIVSLVVLIVAAKSSRHVKKIAYVAVPTLFLFGVSDIVEVYTRAWWRPFWLLLWKGLCIIVLVVCVVYYLRETLKRGDNNESF